MNINYIIYKLHKYYKLDIRHYWHFLLLIRHLVSLFFVSLSSLVVFDGWRWRRWGWGGWSLFFRAILIILLLLISALILNSVTGPSWRPHSSSSLLSCSHAQARQGGIRQKQKRLETTLETTLQTRRLTTIPLRRWVNHARRKDVDLPTGADLYLLNTSHQEADLEDQDVGRLRTNSTGSQ